MPGIALVVVGIFVLAAVGIVAAAVGAFDGIPDEFTHKGK